MTDMTPIAVRLTAEHVQALLEGAGARKVTVVGRGLRLLAFFEYGRKRQAWVIRNGWLKNFERDVAREFAQ